MLLKYKHFFVSCKFYCGIANKMVDPLSWQMLKELFVAFTPLLLKWLLQSRFKILESLLRRLRALVGCQVVDITQTYKRTAQDVCSVAVASNNSYTLS